MKQAPLIGSVTALSLLMLGLIMSHQSTANSRPLLESRNAYRLAEPNQTPLLNPFQSLAVAAKSLPYLSRMKYAIAAINPEILMETETVLTDAEVRLTGVGPLNIGMTLEEATDALGLPVVPIGSNISGECSYYQPDTSAQAIGLMVVDNRVIRVDVWPGSSLPTVSGVTIGSSEAELREIYPDQLEATPNPYTQGEFLTLVPNDPELSLYRLVFETDDQGDVVQYRTGQFPAVTWPDGCV
ncbi:MAG: hypothetical protein AAF773_21635 [Cyanobacteria bacterium P01_D01_bin.115]